MLTAMRRAFVGGEQLGRRSAARLILELDVGESLPVGVTDDAAGVGLLDGPGRREAALRLKRAARSRSEACRRIASKP
jgi:hypothetical protein